MQPAHFGYLKVSSMSTALISKPLAEAAVPRFPALLWDRTVLPFGVTNTNSSSALAAEYGGTELGHAEIQQGKASLYNQVDEW